MYIWYQNMKTEYFLEKSSHWEKNKLTKNFELIIIFSIEIFKYLS